ISTSLVNRAANGSRALTWKNTAIPPITRYSIPASVKARCKPSRRPNSRSTCLSNARAVIIQLDSCVAASPRPLSLCCSESSPYRVCPVHNRRPGQRPRERIHAAPFQIPAHPAVSVLQLSAPTRPIDPPDTDLPPPHKPPDPVENSSPRPTRPSAAPDIPHLPRHPPNPHRSPTAASRPDNYGTDVATTSERCCRPRKSPLSHCRDAHRNPRSAPSQS